MAVNFLVPLVRGAVQLMFGGSRLTRLLNLIPDVKDVTKMDIVIEQKGAYAEFNAAFESVNGVTKGAFNNLAEQSKRFGANAAARLAMITPPMAGGVKKAEKILEGDIHEIFKPLETIPFPSLVLAKNWTAVRVYNYQFESKKMQKALEAGKMNVLYNAFAYSSKKSDYKPYDGELNIIGEPNRASHSAAKGQDNRPSGKVFHVMGPKKQAEMAIQAYATKMKQNIGKMGGGWMICYRRLGGKGFNFPSRFSKNGVGTAIFYKNKDSIEVSCQNKFGNFNNYMMERKGMFMSIMDQESKRVIKSHVDFTRNEAKKFIIKPIK